jgi:hypothetical protein
LGIKRPRANVVLRIHDLNIAAALQKELCARHPLEEKGQPIKCTPPHNQNFSHIQRGGIALVLKFMSKSTAVRDEAAAHAPHNRAEALPPARDLRNLLDELDTLEHGHDSVINFTEGRRVFTHPVDRAGKRVCCDTIWGQSQPMLMDAGVRRIVVSRCRPALARTERERYGGTQYVPQDIETQPIDASVEGICSRFSVAETFSRQ